MLSPRARNFERLNLANTTTYSMAGFVRRYHAKMVHDFLILPMKYVTLASYVLAWRWALIGRSIHEITDDVSTNIFC